MRPSMLEVFLFARVMELGETSVSEACRVVGLTPRPAPEKT